MEVVIAEDTVEGIIAEDLLAVTVVAEDIMVVVLQEAVEVIVVAGVVVLQEADILAEGVVPQEVGEVDVQVVDDVNYTLYSNDKSKFVRIETKCISQLMI